MFEVQINLSFVTLFKDSHDILLHQYISAVQRKKTVSAIFTEIELLVSFDS